jgi:hypothetical protein
MCYWNITESGKVVSRTTVQHVTKAEMLDTDVRSMSSIRPLEKA